MSLRVRLTLYFTLIVVVPLAIAAFTARAVIARELEQRAADELALGLQAISTRVELLRARAGDLAEDLALAGPGFAEALARGDEQTLTATLQRLAGGGERADVGVVADPQGAAVASWFQAPLVQPGASPPSMDQLAELAAAGETGPFVVGEVRPLRSQTGRELGAVLSGRWVDGELAADLRGDLPLAVTLFVEGRPVATTADDLEFADAGGGLGPEPRVERATGPAIVRSTEFEGWTVVASGSRAPLDAALRVVDTATAGILLAAAIAAALLGWLLSQVVVQPVRELAEAANEVTGGDLDRRIDIPGRDELAALGSAFNTMTGNLRTRLRELELSRDALQQSLERLGQTLTSTLDLNRTLSAVVDAALTALTAERAALYMLAPGRQHLYVKVARGIDRSFIDRRVALGDGLVGWVARTAASARVPDDLDVLAWPSADEPGADGAIAVPLFTPTGGAVIGVLALYDRVDAEPFDDQDLRTLRTFAVQTSVAIENVRLHEATQQASVTDGLTGLWNVRYFNQRVEEEVERAARFGHDLSLILLDIDRFKSVNDRYGHLVGDVVLQEVSRRVAAETREVDTLARYGGEELVLVLPETDLEGARLTAERIRESVAGDPVEADAHELQVTVSLGVATFPDHGDASNDLLAAADAALYVAKESGRNRTALASSNGSGPAGA